MVRITTESRDTTPHIRFRENVMDGESTQGGKKKTSLETKVYWLCHVAPGLSARQLELYC